MTPERRAEVVAELRSSLVGCDEPLTAFERARRDAADELETKPSESSMVQRIVALEKALRKIARIGSTRGGCCGVCGAGEDEDCGQNCVRLIATEALDGPPDPERDRETRAEVERP